MFLLKTFLRFFILVLESIILILYTFISGLKYISYWGALWLLLYLNPMYKIDNWSCVGDAIFIRTQYDFVKEMWDDLFLDWPFYLTPPFWNWKRKLKDWVLRKP